MIHTRKQIIENQGRFRKEIEEWLKNEFVSTKKELAEIETSNRLVKEAQEKLLKRFKKIKISKEIERFFISEKNLYPKFYAWWDEAGQEVVMFKYQDL